MALKNVTVARFEASLRASFISGIAADLRVSEDLIVITSVTISNVTRRRILSSETSDAALDVAFEVTGEACY